jgi:hypothetical protein
MKKLYSFALVLVFCVAGAFAVNENVVVWEQIYRRAESYEQRTAIMLKIMELKDRDFAPVLKDALDDINIHKVDTGSNRETYAMMQLARLVVQELGNLKSSDASSSIFETYIQSDDPGLKSEAAIALGKIRATEYAERFAADLTSINLKPDSGEFRGQEIIALGLVKGLDLMRSQSGYESVFLASLGWYSQFSKVKETAQAALLTMVDDPTDSILNIIKNNPQLATKNTALETVLLSKAPKDRKALVASTALELAISRVESDVTAKALASRLRVTAMNALIGLEDHRVENVPLYVTVIKEDKKNDATLEETLKAYMALGVNGTDDAAKFLASKLSSYNDLERSKANTVRDKSLIRQIVASMRASKNPAVKNALTEGLYVDYDLNILKLMKDALSSL